MNKEETIVVPEKMSVSELRDWLQTFGESNRTHYEKNKVQKTDDPCHNGIKQPIQDVGKPISATSSTVSSSSRESTSLVGMRQLTDDSMESGEHVELGEEGKEVTFIEAVIHKEAHNSIFRSLPLSNSEEAIEEGREQQAVVNSGDDRSPHPFHDEDCHIVSISKLLEAPKPVRRPTPATSWDELLQDDFSDPFDSIRDPASFVWQSSGSKPPKTMLRTPAASVGDVPEGYMHSTVSDEVQPTSEPNLTPNKSKAAVRGSLRSRLPMLLCKPGNSSRAESKLVQRTFDNGLGNSAFRALSPHPSRCSAEAFDSRSTIDEPASTLDSLVDRVSSRNDRLQEERDSTVSCPDFAAATAYLHQFSIKAEKKEAPTPSAERARERLSRRERRKYLAASRLAEEQYGTSAILPGAVDASLGRVFALEDSETTPKMDYRPPRKAPSNGRVSDRVSRFGGGGRRPSSVQLRQQELQKQWESNRAVQHVKKVKWQVSNTGNYKKKVVVDKEPIE